MNLNKDDGNYLLDFYGELLTERQREVLSYYLYDDCSMSEIADNLDISKTAVSDIINRAYKQLLEYEDKLKMYEDYKARKSLYQSLKELNDPRVDDYVMNLEKIDNHS